MSTADDNEVLAWLTSNESHPVINAARNIGTDVAAIANFRSQYPQLPVTLISEAITQASLRDRAERRWHESTDFLLTSDGLEQATNPRVTNIHAETITQAFGPQAHIIDLTCGLGFDSAAFLRAGHRVTAIESDATIAQLARHNLATISAEFEVIHGDAMDFEIPADADVIYVDPARRQVDAPRDIRGNTRRVLSANDWSPPWSFVPSIAERTPVLAKVAPGITDDSLGDWDATFMSLDGALVEAMVKSASWPNNNYATARRHAMIIDGHSVVVHDGELTTPAREMGKYLVVPNPALVRARNLNIVADAIHGGLVHPEISWLTSDDEQAVTALTQALPGHATCFEVLQQSTLHVKNLKADIAKIPHSALTIMTRGVKVDVDSFRKKVIGATSASAPELVLATYRSDGTTPALLCRRLS